MRSNYSCFVSILSVLFSITLTTLNATQSQPASESKEHEVLYENHNMESITLKIFNDTTRHYDDVKLTFDQREMAQFNVTKNQIENKKLTREPDGGYSLELPGGRKLPVNLGVQEIINFINRDNNNTSFYISKEGFLTRTLEDLKGEPSLKIEEPPVLSWPQPNNNTTSCDDVKTPIVVSISPKELSIRLRNKTLVNKAIWNSSVYMRHDSQGLFLIVLNPWTCKQTFSHNFPTFDFGFFRELIWVLENISPGRFVILASMGSASLKLDAARDKLSSLGSSWADFFLHRDGWLTAGFVGGKIISEVLIPNFGNFFTAGSPLLAEVILSRPDVSSTDTCYSEWPTGAEWDARRIFCDSNDGYGKLCDCQKPFQIPSTTKENFKDSLNGWKNFSIPLLIAAGNRTRHLFRLIESVGNQDGVTKESFLIFTDSEWKQTHQLAFILGLHILFHRSTAQSQTLGRIAVNLQFGIYHSLNIFPLAKYFIVLEEDLVLAPDFYAYMRHFAPIFEMDKTIFCVSAFNHLSYPHTSKDPSQVYRVRTYPAYGWMVSREIAEFLVPKFLPGQVSQDWDYFMGSDIISQKREILVPDINRSYHWATGGIHAKEFLLTEENFLSRNINKEPVVSYVPLESLLRKNYEKEFIRLVRKAESIRIDDEFSNFSSPVKEGGIYRVFVHKTDEKDELAFRIIGEMLQVWQMDGREHHNHAWRMNYKNATLFVIGTPISPYRKLRRRHESVLMPLGNVTLADHLNEAYSSLQLSTHKNASKLPDFFYTNNNKNNSKVL